MRPLSKWMGIVFEVDRELPCGCCNTCVGGSEHRRLFHVSYQVRTGVVRTSTLQQMEDHNMDQGSAMAKLGADARKQHGKAEGLGDIIVGAQSRPRIVSKSVSWPVSMMIGALKPFLRKMRTASRPSMSGSPTSMITRSICPALAA